MPETIATLHGVTKTYPGVSQPVFSGVDLALAPGESLAIVGPSGSGKTTLLNLLGGLDKPDQGRVTLDGRDPATLADDQLSALRNRFVGFVFQSHHLLPQCTALENVIVPTLVHPDAASRADAPSRAATLLERVGLTHRLDHRPNQMSLGECQRVAIARAMINRPKLILADEPTGSLDHKSGLEAIDMLLSLSHDDRVALVVVTHSPEIASRMSRTLTLHDGTLH